MSSEIDQHKRKQGGNAKQKCNDHPVAGPRMTPRIAGKN